MAREIPVIGVCSLDAIAIDQRVNTQLLSMRAAKRFTGQVIKMGNELQALKLVNLPK